LLFQTLEQYGVNGKYLKDKNYFKNFHLGIYKIPRAKSSCGVTTAQLAKKSLSFPEDESLP